MVQGDIRHNTHLTREEVKATFPHLHPTEKELSLGLLHAYELAANRIELESKAKAKEHAKNEALRMWTYEEQRKEFFEVANHSAAELGFEFEVDEYNEQVIHLLCLYFTNNPAFEEYDFGGIPYSLQKGIWLQSSVRGSGKSFLMHCFKRNKRNCYHFQHVPELRMFLLKGGIEELNQRSKIQPTAQQLFNFLQTDKGFCYDEMFGEEKANYMGNPFYVSEYVIQRLYDQKQAQNQYWKFHLTSNYDGEAIEQKCGATVRSRMVEMFNLIKLEGVDRRKKFKR